jgi:CubicO group peptidase (beta-lactamase class C family)
MIDLRAPVGDYLDEFSEEGKGRVTLVELLTHTSGLPNWRPLYLQAREPSDVPADIARILSSLPRSNASPALVYSDLNYILLGYVLERVTGERLDRLAEKEIFKPLGLKRTMFNPPSDLMRETAATERGQMFEQANALEEMAISSPAQSAENSSGNPGAPDRTWRNNVIWGEVHDGNAHFLGGVAGHAGLFSTAREVFKIASQFLQGSELVKSDSLPLFTKNLTPGQGTARSIACIIAQTKDCAAGPALAPNGIGHNGFTGTSVWMDPEKRRVFVLLSNRIHPKVVTIDMKEIRQQFNRLAVESLNGEMES